MSDRLHNAPTPDGEYFETGRFAGLSVLLGVIAFVAHRGVVRPAHASDH